MAEEFTPQQLELLRRMLAEKQETAQPREPKRFSKAWGQQPLHLFFDPPKLYNPPAQHVRRGDAWYERGEFHRAYEEYTTACKKLRLNGWLCKGLAAVAEPHLLVLPWRGCIVFSITDKLEWYFLFNRLALCALRAKNYGTVPRERPQSSWANQEGCCGLLDWLVAAAAIGDEFSARGLYGQAEVYNPEIDEFC